MFKKVIIIEVFNYNTDSAAPCIQLKEIHETRNGIDPHELISMQMCQPFYPIVHVILIGDAISLIEGKDRV